MPKITEKWIQERVIWLGGLRGEMLSIDEIEKRFIKPNLSRGVRVLSSKGLPEHEVRILYAQQLRDLKLDVDESDFLSIPCRMLTSQSECREDNRVL
jgi:hypothetical protein